MPLQGEGVRQIVLTRNGELIRHPDFTVQRDAETANFINVVETDEPELRQLWAFLSSSDRDHFAGYAPSIDSYIAVDTLGEPDWLVISQIEGSRVRRDSFRAARPILEAGVASTLLFLLATFLFIGRRISGPLQRIAKRADAIAALSSDTDAPEGSTGRNEVARLSRAFDKMEDRLARERERISLSFDTLVDAVDDYAMLLLTPNGKIVLRNEAADRMFGWEDQREPAFASLFAPNGDQGAAQKLIDVASSELRITQRAQRTGARGLRFWATETLAALIDQQGDLIGFAYILRDDTEEREQMQRMEDARDNAEAAAEMRMNLLATVSHEIRTPMTGILGMLDQMKRDRSANARAQALTTIEESAEILLRVVDDVLQHARMESGEIQLDEQDFDTQELIERVAGLFRPLAKRKGITLVAEDRCRRRLVGDAIRIQQVLSNFTSNAIKFTSRGAVRLICEARPAGENALNVEFSVEDSGVGIDPDQLPRLFDPFEQAGPETAKRYGGTGLGLSICRKLAEAMSGRVSAESQPGHGSKFKLEVPLAVASEDDRRPGTGQNAVIVDPSASGRILGEAIAAELGFAATGADDPAAVGEIGHADLILFDADAFELSEIAEGRHVRVGYVSLGNVERLSELRSAGVQHIIKPLDTDEVRKLLRSGL